MVIFKPGTLGCAGVTDAGTQFTDRVRIGTASGHVLRRQEADIGTIPQQLNALGARLDIRFMETGGSTVFTFHRTVLTGLDTRCVLFMWQREIPLLVFPPYPVLVNKLIPYHFLSWSGQPVLQHMTPFWAIYRSIGTPLPCGTRDEMENSGGETHAVHSWYRHHIGTLYSLGG